MSNQPDNHLDKPRALPLVNGVDCPSCGHATLFLGSGGYITCGLEDCPNPDYAEAIDQYYADFYRNKILEARKEAFDQAMRAANIVNLHQNGYHDAEEAIEVLRNKELSNGRFRR